MAVEPANVAGRIAGALLGFQLNGRITFADADSALGRTQLLRYIAMWLATTAFSTAGVGLVDARAGLHWAWVLKPGVDVIAGGLGFLLSRHWVYRR
jgi:putative flippase GtrA